jgi:quercetin dioxygenase-like cupin family protein
MSANPTQRSNLPPVHRYITTHNQQGLATFDEQIPAEAQWTQPVEGADFFLGYCTTNFPVQINQDADINAYKPYLQNNPGLVVHGGSVCRFVDFLPGCPASMHRTTSVDYGVVLEGQLELTLDSGEQRIMNRGDVCVQRATNHAWRNTSETQWVSWG